MYNEIKTTKDIKSFLDKTNSLHDGYFIGTQYSNNGIAKIEGGYVFWPEQTKLIIQIQVTSIWDTIVEIEFENLLEWQIKDNQYGITEAMVMFNDQNWIVWTDETYIDMDEMKTGSYVIAKSMKWRIVE